MGLLVVEDARDVLAGVTREARDLGLRQLVFGLRESNSDDGEQLATAPVHRPLSVAELPGRIHKFLGGHDTSMPQHRVARTGAIGTVMAHREIVWQDDVAISYDNQLKEASMIEKQRIGTSPLVSIVVAKQNRRTGAAV